MRYRIRHGETMKAKDEFAKISPNLMTPNAMRFYDLPDGTMVELSQGTGFENEPIYGVSVISPDGSPNHNRSRLFHDLEKATKYIVEELT